MKHTSKLRGTTGFTLLELMVVVAVAAVLAAVAAPSFATFIDNQRLRSASFDIVSDLSLARSEALTRQTTVVITPATVSGGGWADGWRLNLGSSAGALVTSRTGVAPKVRFAAANSSGSAVSSLSIGPDGRVVGLTPMSIEVTLADTLPAGVTASCVRIDATGRPRSTKGACS
jgi:type IV fimbrial biogenesis protein FimT